MLRRSVDLKSFLQNVKNKKEVENKKEKVLIEAILTRILCQSASTLF